MQAKGLLYLKIGLIPEYKHHQTSIWICERAGTEYGQR